jgi:GDPmannose 4,6-dehydratase
MERKKTALITGIGGQDGSYLAELLIGKGYRVAGVIRRASWPNTQRIWHLIQKYEKMNDPESPLRLYYADMTDASSIRAVLEKCHPDEIYNLAAQSHVGISFDSGESTLNINALGTFRLLDAIRDMKLNCKFYQASSSELFGISPPPQNEDTPMQPQSPYGIAKLAAFHLTKLYRNAYGIYACNGILFNHESPRRGVNFVTKKITMEIAKILVGETNKIELGNLDAKRDWGFSKEYVEGMWMILQQEKPDDFVLSTGEMHTVREFLQECFSLLGLNYENFIEIKDRYKRPAEVPALLGDSTKARRVLRWDPKVKFHELAKMMLAADLKEKFERVGIIPVDLNNEKSDDFYIEKGRELAKLLKKYLAEDLKKKLKEVGLIPAENGVEMSDDFYIEKGRELARLLNEKL